MNMNPIVRVIMLIFTLAGVAQFLYNNFDSIREKWTEVWQNFSQSHPIIAKALEGIWSALTAPYRMICSLVDKVKEMIGLEPSSKLKYTELEGAYKAGKREDWEDQNVIYDEAGNIMTNARGGIYGRGAFLTTFAEESPEAAIPLDGSPRAVGLWQQAGEMLGMKPAQPAIGGNTYIFSPTIQGGIASAGEIQSMLRTERDSFEQQMNAWASQKARVSYA